MSVKPPALKAEVRGNAVFFGVRAVPRSSRNMAAGVLDGALRLKITAPPVEGKANKAISAFLAKALSVPKSRVSIASGEASRRKTVRVDLSSPEEGQDILARLKALAGSS